jgi:hypothetical protein
LEPSFAVTDKITRIPISKSGDEQNVKGRGFDTPSGGGGGSADEHKQYGEQLRALAQAALGNSVEACGSRRGSLEKAGQKFLKKIQSGERLIFFQNKKGDRTGRQKTDSGLQHDSRVVRKMFPLASEGFSNILDHQKPQASAYYQKHGVQVYQGIGDIVLQAVPKCGKTGIAERRNRVKQRIEHPQAFAAEGENIEEKSYRLKNEGVFDYRFDYRLRFVFHFGNSILANNSSSDNRYAPTGSA